MRMRVPPNVQVRMISEPASANELASLSSVSGSSMIRSSGGLPGLRPIFCKLEPVAPSATRISPLFNRSKNLFMCSPQIGRENPPLQNLLAHEIFRHRVRNSVGDQMCDMGKWFAHVREAGCKHELILKFRIGGQFKALHFTSDRIDLIAFFDI